jgi:hypothetical protein
MKLANDQELANTRQKLLAVLDMIERRERDTTPHPAREDSLRSLREFAGQLQGEISEYEASQRQGAGAKVA